MDARCESRVTTPIIKDENTKKFSGNLFSSFLFLLTIGRNTGKINT